MPLLTYPGWSADCNRQLTELIERGAGQRLPVVFDFDNTLVCGDIGEATLAWLARDRRIAPGTLPHLFPAFAQRDGRAASPAAFKDPTGYYEALLDPTVHGEKDPTPLSSGYVWAVEVMQGLTPEDVMRATERVWRLSEPGKIRTIEVSPGGGSYPVPFFYLEMVDLISELLRRDYDLWVISASNVWSVRWAISQVLNVPLRALGVGTGIKLNQVIGVSTLLSRADGTLCKDAVLVKEDVDYLELKPAALSRLQLTRWLQFPVPTYSGKVGVIWDYIGRRPYLGVGDSPGDLPMLSFCENRLWIDRIDKPRYRQAMELTRHNHPGVWISQPVRTREAPAFVPFVPGR